MSGTPETSAGVSEEESRYFRTIEERFCRLRGASLLLSPRDWSLIASWWDQRIPLPIILETLEDAFAARRRQGEAVRPIGSLAYVRAEVEHRFRLHREMAAVRRGEEEESARLRREIRLHLGRLARRLVSASGAALGPGGSDLRRELLTAAAEIRRLRAAAGRSGWEPQSTDKALQRIDSEVLETARRGLSDEALRALQEQALQQLGAVGRKMSAAARRETLQALEDELTRRTWEIPRIALLG